jgi:hypothetical protein
MTCHGINTGAQLVKKKGKKKRERKQEKRTDQMS